MAATHSQIKRGEYIVKHVAMCIECHTPRDSQGRLLESQALQGAPIPVNRPPWAKSWAIRSLNIDGLTKWTDEEGVHFLETGVRPDGTRPMLPMPPYRMSREDAEAVVAYLKHGQTGITPEEEHESESRTQNPNEVRA